MSKMRKRKEQPIGRGCAYKLTDTSDSEIAMTETGRAASARWRCIGPTLNKTPVEAPSIFQRKKHTTYRNERIAEKGRSRCRLRGRENIFFHYSTTTTLNIFLYFLRVQFMLNTRLGVDSPSIGLTANLYSDTSAFKSNSRIDQLGKGSSPSFQHHFSHPLVINKLVKWFRHFHNLLSKFLIVQGFGKMKSKSP